MDSVIAQPLNLKCGLVLKNRLVKAAMAEQMADENGLPTTALNKVYSEWAKGDWGMILTGNVQVDPTFLGTPKDHTVISKRKEELIRKWKSWVSASTQEGAPLVMQINHPGRQSPLGAGTKGLFAKNIAPSPVSIDLGPGVLAKLASSFVFGRPREMSQTDIDNVIQQFVSTSRLASEAGFQGVEIHAAHGYLLAQFLSSKTNLRTDAYGNTPAGRAKIVVEIVKSIRGAIDDKTFCIGIKLNSVDHQSAEELHDSLQQLREIVDAGVDFVEISGGSYEDPTMLQPTSESLPEKSARTVAREAFFLEFAHAIRGKFPEVPLVVTGGFRTRRGMTKAIEDGACDMVGIGRPAVLNPTLPKDILLNQDVSDEDSRLETKVIPPSRISKLTGIKSLTSGAESMWYSQYMAKRVNHQ